MKKEEIKNLEEKRIDEKRIYIYIYIYTGCIR